MVLGCRQRGRPRDKPFDHETGRGFVQHHDGQYRDAIVNKGSRVIPMIVETLGGVAPHSLAYVGYLAKRAKGKTSKDGTRYGTSRTSTTSFFVHHTQRISVAVQQWDAAAILRSVAAKKRKQIAAAIAVGGAA